MDAFLDRPTAFLVRHGRLLKDPESMLAAFIMTFWSVMAGALGGWLAILILFGIAGVLHIGAVESGSHVMLWVATSGLLLLIVIASQATFGGLPAWLLTVAGTSAFGYSELIRINYLRRRNAVIHEEVYHASGTGVVVSGAIGLVGVVAASILADADERNWLWVPVASAVLLAIGLAITAWPARRPGEADKERWEPGERIPPQPLGKDEGLNY